MSPNLDTALDESLSLMKAGVDRRACLARYSQYASELDPLLKLASGLRLVNAPKPTVAAHNAGQRRMLEALRKRRIRIRE
jgi:hypothetical protein